MVRLSVAMGLAFGLIACGFEFRRDLGAEQIGADAALAAHGHVLPADLPFWEGVCGDACPSRALLAGAAARAGAAQGKLIAQRNRLLNDAEARLARSVDGRPLDGESWIEISYVRALRDGALSPSTLAALSHSYRIDRFNRRGALWRLRLADAGWERLDEETKARALDEATWLWAIDGHERDRIMASLARTDSRLAFGERLQKLHGTYDSIAG